MPNPSTLELYEKDPIERIAEALESIAESLKIVANPPFHVKTKSPHAPTQARFTGTKK